MEEKDFYNVTASLPSTHCFCYKEMQFPFNISLFNCFSDYFQSNQDEIQQDNSVKLLNNDTDENIDLSENTIRCFISFFQLQKIQINNDNVIHLNYLSKKYKVQKLIDLTNDYIFQHHNELMLQLLSIYEKSEDSERIRTEEHISEYLSDYINNDLLLSFSVPTLYRILSKQKSKINENDLANFLIRCLQKNGRPASILFSFVDVGKADSIYLQRLLTEFSDSFDFHFINSTFLKTVYEQQSEMIKNYEEIKCKIEEKMKLEAEEVSRMKEENEIMRNENAGLKMLNESLVNQVNLMKDEADSMREENKRMKSEADSMRDEFKKMKGEMDSMRDEFVKIKGESDTARGENNKAMDEMKSMRNEFARMRDDIESFRCRLNFCRQFLYDGNDSHCFCGIIKYLTDLYGGNVDEKKVVGVTASSVFSDYHEVKNAVNFNDHNRFFASKHIVGSWIKYNFNERRVRPTHYSIRTRHNDDTQNPRTWVIEGSNTDRDNDWKILDRRNDEQYLRGRNLQHTFEIQEKLDAYERYQYIRLRQTGKTFCNDDLLAISSLEYFGYLYSN